MLSQSEFTTEIWVVEADWLRRAISEIILVSTWSRLEFARFARSLVWKFEANRPREDVDNGTRKADTAQDEHFTTLEQTPQEFAGKMTETGEAVIVAEAKLPREMKRQSSLVKLDVGGHKYTTSLTTLRSQPDSILTDMFNRRYQPTTDEDGAYFIDRDGTHYRHILNYLRDATDLEETLPQTREAN